MKSVGCLAILAFFALIALLRLAPDRAATPSPTALSCPTQKITFTQATGCLNDGSFEFCIPADDPAALKAVQQIAPGVNCIQAGGRAHCNLDTQRLCMVDTAGMCTATHGAMNASGWQTVCAFAALPFVDKVVPTWYE